MMMMGERDTDEQQKRSGAWSQHTQHKGHRTALGDSDRSPGAP